mmetsp:Transcript_8265/g.17618  ORF Transcript_8265/g.17618 Transcript_8265/m.17618 type:complete len:213 (+) Transcript_8265:188-826(+)
MLLAYLNPMSASSIVINRSPLFSFTIEVSCMISCHGLARAMRTVCSIRTDLLIDTCTLFHCLLVCAAAPFYPIGFECFHILRFSEEIRSIQAAHDVLFNFTMGSIQTPHWPLVIDLIVGKTCARFIATKGSNHDPVVLGFAIAREYVDRSPLLSVKWCSVQEEWTAFKMTLSIWTISFDRTKLQSSNVAAELNSIAVSCSLIALFSSKPNGV